MNKRSLSCVGSWVATGLLLLFSGCTADTSGEVTLSLTTRGTALSEVELEDGTAIVPERADIAFGPLYLCSGNVAGRFCETARLQWLESTVVDVLDPDVQEAGGEVRGLEGTVRSWMFDLGLVSTLASREPLRLSAVDDLGDNNVRLAGRTRVVGLNYDVPFSADFRLIVTNEVEQGATLVHSTQSVAHGVQTGLRGVEVTFSAAPWFERLRATDFIEARQCDIIDRVTCQGPVETRCDEAGQLVSETDCRQQAQICAPGVGCAEEIVFVPGSRAHRALSTAIVTSTTPTFVFR